MRKHRFFSHPIKNYGFPELAMGGADYKTSLEAMFMSSESLPFN
jgi:hypothetical protein